MESPPPHVTLERLLLHFGLTELLRTLVGVCRNHAHELRSYWANPDETERWMRTASALDDTRELHIKGQDIEAKNRRSLRKLRPPR